MHCTRTSVIDQTQEVRLCHNSESNNEHFGMDLKRLTGTPLAMTYRWNRHKLGVSRIKAEETKWGCFGLVEFFEARFLCVTLAFLELTL